MQIQRIDKFNAVLSSKSIQSYLNNEPSNTNAIPSKYPNPLAKRIIEDSDKFSKFLSDWEKIKIPRTSNAASILQQPVNANYPSSRQDNDTEDLISLGESSKLELVIENEGTSRKLQLLEKITVIGDNTDTKPDYYLLYLSRNQIFVTQNNKRAFIQESASAQLAACIKIKESILYLGACFKIGSRIFQVEEINARGSIKLSVRIKEGEKLFYSITEERATIGRGSNSTIQIDDLSIWKQHAQISLRYGIWVISDLYPRLGVWRFLHNASSLLNQTKSPPIEIKDEDIIKLEGASITVESSD